MASTLQTMREGGTQHPEDIMNFLTSRLIVGTGGIFDKDDNDSFFVDQESVPAMSVKVDEGYAFLRKSGDSMVYPVRLYDGDASVVINANASGNSRIDAIVLYIDLGASANSAVTNVAKLIAIEGTPAGSPSAPSDADIEAEIGASNPYLRLANVTVANGAVSIVTANISDQRQEVTLDNGNKFGWRKITDAISYSSYDSTVKTGVLTIPAGGASKYSVGWRVWFYQPTDGWKFGIVTKVADTALTIYLGTDYDLDNEAITYLFVSDRKAPFGFPLDPIKWTQSATDTSSRTQGSPTANVWYNVGSLQIAIPIGAWLVEWNGALSAEKSSAEVGAYGTLSTANNSESDVEFTVINDAYAFASIYQQRRKHLNLSAKTTYYLNVKTSSTGASSVGIRGDWIKTVMRAVCAYL